MPITLPPELFHSIITFLEDDPHVLCRCARVSRTFHSSATPLLYKLIHISPPETVLGRAWRFVEDTLGRKPFAASQLPSHRAYVQVFILDGYLTKTGPTMKTSTPILHRIPEALRSWKNINSVTITPQYSSKGSALMKVVETLRECPSLRAVTVNEYCLDDEIAPHLAAISGLEDVTVINPTRAACLILRDWLGKNQNTLLALKLMGNCGSLTPGILRSIIPCLSKIRTLAIGLSYSLTNTDIFSCLSQLPRLGNLRLRYYPQYGTLPPAPTVPKLQHLTVLHTTLFSKDEAGALSAWIRRIASSSSLESLETISLGSPGPKLCFDGLISHLASKHGERLRSICMPAAYVRGPAFQSLLDKCRNLRHISLTITFNTLQALPFIMGRLLGLRTIALDICDSPDLVLEKKDAMKIMECVPELRCITIRNVTWKGTWVAQQDEDGHVSPEFVVSLTTDISRENPLDEF